MLAQAQSTVDRLLMAEDDRQKRMKYLKHKLRNELLDELQEKPKITSHPSHKKKREKIYEKSVSPSREASAVVNRRNIVPFDSADQTECTLRGLTNEADRKTDQWTICSNGEQSETRN